MCGGGPREGNKDPWVGVGEWHKPNQMNEAKNEERWETRRSCDQRGREGGDN